MDTKEKLLKARALIQARRYEEAQILLRQIDHPTATEWLSKLEKMLSGAGTPQAPTRETPATPPPASVYQSLGATPASPAFKVEVKQADPPPPTIDFLDGNDFFPNASGVPSSALPTGGVIIGGRTGRSLSPLPDLRGKKTSLPSPLPASKGKTRRTSSTVLIAAGVVGLCLVACAGFCVISLISGARAANDLESALDSLQPTLPPARPIAYGQTVTSTLDDARPEEVFSFTAAVGDYVQIDMTSEVLDSQLSLLDPNGEEMADNDDIVFGVNKNSRLRLVLTRVGEYRIVAERFGFDSGAYTLVLTKGAGTSVRFGSPVAGVARREAVELWTVFLYQGDSVLMQASPSTEDSFPTLVVYDPAWNEISRDDDAFDGGIAEINAQTSGLYSMVIGSWGFNDSPYTFVVNRR